jgi:hypothetical protein
MDAPHASDLARKGERRVSLMQIRIEKQRRGMEK